MTTSLPLLAALALCAASAAPGFAADRVLHIDFEDYALGPLASPWSVQPPGSPSNVSIVDGGQHGHVLQLDGDAAEGQFVVASLGLRSRARRVQASFEVLPTAGATFVWSLSGAGDTLGARRVRLQVAPGDDMLVAQTSPSGSTPCATLAAGRWSRVTLAVDTRRTVHRFDVKIDGQPTACTGIETGLGAPFDGIAVMDASNSGWGGQVRFDDFAVEGR